MAASWSLAAPGVWRVTLQEMQEAKGMTPLTYMNVQPREAALKQMPEVQPPFDWDQVRIEEIRDGLLVSFPLTPSEKLYGTGLQLMRMNQRGRTRYLRVNSDPKQDTGETHAPVPFYASDRGYGVLIDTSRIVTMHCGSTLELADTRAEHVRDRNTNAGWSATPLAARTELRLPKDGFDIYVFGGPSLTDVVARYNLFCGGGVLPPKWGLGFWHRVPTLYTDEQVLEEAEQFRQRGIPCDVIGLEPGWHSQSYPVSYEWEANRFPSPGTFVQQLRAKGMRVNLWEHPYVSPTSKIYEKLRPYAGSHTVWGGLAPDYAMEEAAAQYKQVHETEHVSLGVSGYKLDECDGSELTRNSWMFPAHAKFPSGLDGEQMRQLYGLMFQKMTSDLYRSKNRRTYGLVRASGAAASTMPYVLYSDLYDHKQYIRALCNASFSGLLWTPEVRRAVSAEDWVRRMQTVCLSSLAMLNAWGDGTKPWSYPEVESIVRHYIELRMRLLPYLYTAFAAYRETGVPPFRAMPLVMSPAEIAAAEGHLAEFEQEVLNTTDAAYGKKTTREWDDQYMLGEFLLVAPLVAGETERDVLLPGGVWYGLETGERYEGGQIVRISAVLEIMPIFVRSGAVIPMMPSMPHVPEPGSPVPLTFVHFGEESGEGTLYDDDGETFAYEEGASHWWRAQVTRRPDGSYAGELLGNDQVVPESFSTIAWQFAQTRLPR
ncbi:glycoside hydrolase family 31 protein [Paenibacillus whitsoniae]|uniref:Glycoside hydrolase family 31 protein n=2 Tax=Paenibacillus whitsoniae TaxID=2496558 RepID=A0A430J8V1_9BACL|nr:glycoside hydrolase family 31 protein [Paenibacillus whitsoniae]